jgi:hypothetical protein
VAGGSLPLKRRRFAEAYVEHGNGARAAVEAGYSEGSARFTAARLLSDPKVAGYVDAVREALGAQQAGESLERIANLRSYWVEFILGNVDPAATPADRLRASALLGRSIGAFTSGGGEDLRVIVSYEDEAGA